MSFNGTCRDFISLSNDLSTKALKERFSPDDLKWRLRQSLISRQQGLHESLNSYNEFIDTTCLQLGVSKEDQFYYFVNGLLADIKSEVLMHQPKDDLTAVNLAAVLNLMIALLQIAKAT